MGAMGFCGSDPQVSRRCLDARALDCDPRRSHRRILRTQHRRCFGGRPGAHAVRLLASAAVVPTESTAIVGKWQGTGTVPQGGAPTRFEIEFKPDGTYSAETKAPAGWFTTEGRWRYENGVFLSEGKTTPPANVPLQPWKASSKIRVVGDTYEAEATTESGETRTSKARRVR